MYSTAYPAPGSSASEAQMARRAEQQRIQNILAPKDDEVRQRWYAAKAAMDRRQFEAEEQAKTDLYARGLLWSVIGTVLLAAASSLWNVLG